MICIDAPRPSPHSTISFSDKSGPRPSIAVISFPSDAKSAAQASKARRATSSAEPDIRSYHQARARPQDLSISAARHGDHAPEPGLGDGHRLYSDGARLRVSRGRAGLGEPPGCVVATVDHNGGGLLRREAGGRHSAPWQAGDLQHRLGLAVHPRRLAAKGSLERADQATRIKSCAERGAAA